MSLPLYEEQQAKLDLYQKLQIAEEESKETKTRYSHQEVIQDLRAKAHAKI